ncbi:hypothetical protein GCM10017044_10970 [Kordiimonas sediminis]|uniref:Tip attachment protein J domain-containing protein n=1 Tax=Kordiimonas sediminis TaxID=1735581 RepID=A0A919APB2_9PROT|nr:phage tail protein [Kordiimonas sediminis]GHF18264.1 hypothetical protein GCM10017044_10970 [Kordiimonas sediminis]
MGKVVKSALAVAAIAVVSVALPGSTGIWASLGASVGTALGTGLAAGAALAGAAIGAGIGILSSVLAPRPSDMVQQAGIKLPVVNSLDTRKILYGTVRVGGTEIFIEEYDAAGGDNVPNDTLVFARVLADHPVSGFGDFYLGDTNLGPVSGETVAGEYAGKLHIRQYDGQQSQADSWLSAAHPDWGAGHLGTGQAYYVVKAGYDPELFPYGAGELRRCSLEVVGKAVYDPRDSQQDMHAADTWLFSTNPALCILDFLRDAVLNNPVRDDEIDFDSFIAAANVCDEPVTVKGGGTIKRYSLNGVVDCARSKWETVQMMLTAMSGRILWTGGKIRVLAAAHQTDLKLLNSEDIISAVYTPAPPTGQRYNEVRGTYIDPANGYEPRDFPAKRLAADQDDEGQVIFTLNLPFCTDHREAQRHAKIALGQVRQPLLQLETLPIGLAFQPMDVVVISHETLELVNEPFRVVEQTISPAGNGEPLKVQLGLVKEDASIYSWYPDTEEFDHAAPPLQSQGTGRETNMPTGVGTIPVVMTNTDGTETAALQIFWSPPAVQVASTLVDYRPTGTVSWVPAGSALYPDTEVILPLPEKSEIDIRVRHIHGNGTVSAAVVITAISPDVAGSGTLTWGDITGDGKPEDYADVTADAMMELGARWAFNGSDDGWTTENVSLSVADDYISCTTTAANNSITSPADLNIDGSKYTRVIFKMRRTAASGGVDYDTPVLFYATTGHGISTSYRKAVTRPFKLGEWVIFTFDMTKLTAGGTDWTTSTITQLKLDLSFQSGDGFDIDYIALGKPGMPSSGVETPNLIDDKYYTSFPASDTDSPSEYAYVTLEDLGLKVGDVISASIEVQTQGARRGRVGLFFAQSNWTLVKTPGGGLVSTGASEWKVAKLEGYQIPPLTHYVRIIGGRENGVSGAVAFRRPVINRGAVASRPAGTRPDVEEGATNTTNTNQLVDGAGLGQTATWSNITGTGKPENDATKNTGVLADRNTVAEAHIDDYSTTKVGGGEGPGEVSFTVDSGSGLNRTIISASNLTGNDTGREVMVSARAQLRCGSASTEFFIRIVRNGNTAAPLIDEVVTVHTSYRGFSLMVVDENPGTNPDYSFVIRYRDTNRTVWRQNAHITAVSFNR